MLGIHRHNREQALADALAASLDAVRDGAASIEQCLAQHPQFAAELEPLLLIAGQIAVAGRIRPSETAREHARFALLQAAAVKNRPIPIAPRAVVRRRSWLALAPAAVAALLFAAIAVPVLGSVDTNAVPGNWNYSFKRATERVRLALATDSTDRRLLRLEFAERRLNEIERLSSQGHVEHHASQVTSLLKDYTADLNQVTNTTQAQGQIPPAIQQQIEALTPRADAVIQPIVQNAADDKQEVKNAAQNAAVVTRQAQTVAQTLPSTSTPARAVVPVAAQAAPSSASAPATASPHPSTPAPTETVGETATPTPATVTTTPAPTTTGTATPPAQQPAATVVTASPTPTPTAATAQAAATRDVAILTPVTPTPAATATARAATATVGTNDSSGPTPTAATDRTVTASPVAASTARPAATQTPSTATATPARSVSPSPLATRPASVEAGLVVVGRSPDEVRYQWTGPADTLVNIVAPLGTSVVYATYQTGSQPATIWYPGTPSPVISTNQLITVKLKTLGTPGAGLSVTP